MKSIYIKTTWIDNKTPINAANMNKIENALSNITTSAISYSDLVKGDGININISEDKDVKVSVDNTVMRSNTCNKFEIISEELDTYNNDILYLVLDSNTKKLKKLIFNGITIYEVEQ